MEECTLYMIFFYLGQPDHFGFLVWEGLFFPTAETRFLDKLTVCNPESLVIKPYTQVFSFTKSVYI